MHSSSDDESIAEKPTRHSSTISSPPTIPISEDIATVSTTQATPMEPTPIEESADIDAKTLARDANRKEKKKRRKNKILLAGLPSEIANDKQLQKYWHKRFSLFSLYDSGIKLDKGKSNDVICEIWTVNYHWFFLRILLNRKLVLCDTGKSCRSHR